MDVTVLKLGGSLLDLIDLHARLRSLITRLDIDRPLLVCGGGEAADIVRRWQETYSLDEEQSHWLAMDSIQLNQRLLLTLMPKLELVCDRETAEKAWLRDRVPLLDLRSFIQVEELIAESNSLLPHTWDVTSDSLAGWIAIRWPASQFVLLKSTKLPIREDNWSLQDVANAGFVDHFLPRLGPNLPPTFWCDLRDHAVPELVPFSASLC